MGYSVSAYVVVGALLGYKTLFTKKSTRGCSHEVPEDSRFCPNCGKRREILEEVRVDGFDGSTFCGLQVFQDNQDAPVMVVIGETVARVSPATNTQCVICIEKLDAIMERVKKAVRFPAARFGFFLVLKEKC